MKKILIVDSDPAELNARRAARGAQATGAEYAAVLAALRDDLDLTVIAPYDGDVAPDLSGFDGVVFTGSGVEWNTDDPRAAPLADVMRAAFAAGRPTFGSCNGMQLAVSVLGGAVGESPKGREDGLAIGVRLTEAGRTHPMLAGRRDGYAVPCVHRDEVLRMPEGAELLARNDHSAVQALAYDRDGIRFWGVQYHPEYDAEAMAGMLDSRNLTTPQMRADLAVVTRDPAAAERLGTTCAEQTLPDRAVELRNWLATL